MTKEQDCNCGIGGSPGERHDVACHRYASTSSKRMTDRELLRSCMEAMHIAHRVQGARTDWSIMIEDIRRHLESSAHETFARQPSDCKHERAEIKCPDCGIDFIGTLNERAALKAILEYPGLPAVIYGTAQAGLRRAEEPTPVPAPAPDQASAPRAGSAVAGGGSERPSDCCMSAGCKEPAISNSVFCQKHYDALPDLMRAEKAECALCADGVNSFTDPATGNRMHARNGVVAACTAQNGKGEQK